VVGSDAVRIISLVPHSIADICSEKACRLRSCACYLSIYLTMTIGEAIKSLCRLVSQAMLQILPRRWECLTGGAAWPPG
jgi:hypothetical protein